MKEGFIEMFLIAWGASTVYLFKVYRDLILFAAHEKKISKIGPWYQRSMISVLYVGICSVFNIKWIAI